VVVGPDIRRVLGLAALVIGLVMPLQLSAAVSLSLDRARITEGETVMLTITGDDPRQKLEPDLGDLEKDFEILDRRSETQLSIVNGKQTAVVRLMITIEPRRSGTLTIGPLEFGDQRTAPVSLRVDPAPEPDPGQPPPVFIETEIIPGEGPHYVHAQLGLVVRVFYQQNLTEAAISQPDPAPASVRLLQETPFQAERGGERYRVLERTYAIFPERSGELVLPPMQLTGRLVERRSDSIWQPTVRGRRILVESEPLKVMVDPRPAEFTGADWLPARDLRLEQQISHGDSLRVGEPVTRTVIVDAVGLEENMIVEPSWPGLSGARVYPDQPQGITRDDGQWVLGHKEFRYAVVPEAEGELVLPRLEVQWWDTRNDRLRTAVLPEHRLSVAPSALVPPAAAERVLSEAASASSDAPAGASRDGVAELWRTAALIFAALWLFTLVLAWRSGGSRTAGEGGDESDGTAAGESELLRRLERACRAQSAGRARRALGHWLRDYGPTHSASLIEFAAAAGDDGLRASVYALDGEGFRPGSADAAAGVWDGPRFWGQFEAWRSKWLKRRGGQGPEATDLYAPENRIGT
jgi:hypothetical protein